MRRKQRTDVHFLPLARDEFNGFHALVPQTMRDRNIWCTSEILLFSIRILPCRMPMYSGAWNSQTK